MNELQQRRDKRNRREAQEKAFSFLEKIRDQPFFAVVVDPDGAVRLYHKGMDPVLLQEIELALGGMAV